MKTLVYDIPPRASIRHIVACLKQHLRIRSRAPEKLSRRYLDTFDWRLYKCGRVLEATPIKDGWRLSWRGLGDQHLYAVLQLQQLPVFARELEEARALRALKKAAGVRALQAVATVHGEVHSLRVLDKRAKTVLRLEIQVESCAVAGTAPGAAMPAEFPARHLQVVPLRGYKKIYTRVRRILERECGLSGSREDPLETVRRRLQIGPETASATAAVLDPRARADVTAKSIFQRLSTDMERNEPGLRADIDSEFLHEYRVAVRRTRALLSQLHGVLPQPQLQKYRREFAWLGAITGPTRDMDVYLLSFDNFQSSLPPAMRADIDPLYTYLQRHKTQEHRRLIRALDSVRYRRLQRDWREFIDAAVPVKSRLAGAGQRAIVYAGEKNWRIYRKAIKQGSGINAASPAPALHRLRKTCKKLRYMNEFFRDFYPRNKIAPLIGILKKLQNNLGEFQDLKVQEESLRNFIVDIEAETGISSRTRNAITHLVENFEIRETAVRTEFAGHFSRFASRDIRGKYKALMTCTEVISDASR